MMNDNSLGLLLKTTAYKEYDLLASVFLKEYGKVSFILKGFNKPNSKLLSKGQLFTLYNFRFNYKDSGLMNPIEITTKITFSNILSNQSRLCLAQVANQVFLNLEEIQESQKHFQLLENYLELMNDLKVDEKLIVALFLSEVLQESGLSPYVDKALNTGDSKVNDFSIKQGGFMFNKTSSNLTVDELRMIRYIYKGRLSDISNFIVLQVSDNLLELFINYFEYHFNIKLTSYNIYKQII